MSNDPLEAALADARRDDERGRAAAQMEAFHQTFNFCMDCRQYTCTSCWNEVDGRCLTCAPMPGRIETAMATLEPIALPLPEASANGHDREEAWPTIDLPAAEEPVAIVAPEPAAAEAAVAEPGLEPEAVAVAEPVAEPVARAGARRHGRRRLRARGLSAGRPDARRASRREAGARRGRAAGARARDAGAGGTIGRCSRLDDRRARRRDRASGTRLAAAQPRVPAARRAAADPRKRPPSTSRRGPGRPRRSPRRCHRPPRVWEESSVGVINRPGSGVQACFSCGLPLSASARFCRRCGSRQE